MGGSLSVVNECFYNVTVTLNGGLIDTAVLPAGGEHTFEGAHIGQVHMRVGASREKIERRTPVEGVDGRTSNMQFVDILPEFSTYADFVFCDGRKVRIRHDPCSEELEIIVGEAPES